jgi:hypothetical protein
MICKMIFHGGAPECRMLTIDFLEEDNLAFIRCDIVCAAVVDDVEAGELLS